MKVAYCMIPNEDNFKASLSSANLSAVAKLQIQQMHIHKLCFDATGTSWQVHYH